MRVFFNDGRSGYNEIVSYGPSWWPEFREMDAIYKYAGWTLDLMAYFLERLVNNQFPGQADEAALREFEKILDIDYDPNSSLDERRKMALAYYSGSGKLSKSVIQSLIKSYTGCESDVSWKGQVFSIIVLGQDGPQFLNDKLLKILRRRMPAHISYEIEVNEEIIQPQYVGAALEYVPQIVVDCEKFNYTYSHSFYGVEHMITPNIVLVSERR